MMEYQYYAFISYSTKDERWAKKLFHKLESYSLPIEIGKTGRRTFFQRKKKPIKPVFLAPYEINPSPDVIEELQKKLLVSRYLIVLCSPNSATSYYVAEEIRYFYNLGRKDNILFFITDGQPYTNNPKTECFNPVLKELNLNPLAADINYKVFKWQRLNEERAIAQLTARLLGVNFDEVWKRRQRKLIEEIIMSTIGVFLVSFMMIAVWWISRPFKSEIQFIETPLLSLPPHDKIQLTLSYKNTIQKSYMIEKGSDVFILDDSIGRNLKGKNVNISISSPGFVVSDTTVNLTKNITIALKRDVDYYGSIFFQLRNEISNEPVPNHTIYINEKEVITDEHGFASIYIPIEEQKSVYRIFSKDGVLTPSIIMPPYHKKYNNIVFLK